jgi:hypothetical protein
LPEHLKSLIPYVVILCAALVFAFLANRSRGGEEFGADVFIFQVCIYYVEFVIFYMVGRFIRGMMKARKRSETDK